MKNHFKKKSAGFLVNPAASFNPFAKRFAVVHESNLNSRAIPFHGILVDFSAFACFAVHVSDVIFHCFVAPFSF